ncbi:hypothetical protein [Streptomyces sp. NPDC059909]|uniref:hypothetical protein n=1 Tax=Streptomyces sp. NPDC059909 TaxID=3346998 RepID=UPI003652A89C
MRNRDHAVPIALRAGWEGPAAAVTLAASIGSPVSSTRAASRSSSQCNTSVIPSYGRVGVRRTALSSNTTARTVWRAAIGRLLGAGGVGEVWRGVDERPDRPVAVKVLARPGVETPNTRLYGEAQAAAALSHGHAVTPHTSARRR